MNTQTKDEIVKFLFKNKMYQLTNNNIVKECINKKESQTVLMMMKNYGCSSLLEFQKVCEINILKYFQFTEKDIEKWNILLSHFQMLTYSFKNVQIKLLNELPIEKNNNLFLFPYSINVENNYKYLFLNSNGLKCILYNKNKKKMLILEGYIENNSISQHSFKIEKIKNLISQKNHPLFEIFLSYTPFSFFLLNEEENIYILEFQKYISFIQKIESTHIEKSISEFIKLSTYEKYVWIFYLLIDENNIFCANLAIQLFHSLNAENNYNHEQIGILNILPIYLQCIFKENVIKYYSLSKKEVLSITLEERIKLIKIDFVKEKALSKYNELQMKNEESYTKAKSYLEGLLKIPFGIYKKEPILRIMDDIKWEMNYFGEKKRSNIEIYQELNYHLSHSNFVLDEKSLDVELQKINKNILEKMVGEFSLKKYKNKKELISQLLMELKKMNQEKFVFINQTYSLHLENYIIENNLFKKEKALQIKNKIEKIPSYIKQIKHTLDEIIYGQEDAKLKLQLIFGQWLNGEQKGYCFGFEGLPGIGKTSLGKGISKCLKDEEGKDRPFHIIQLGGSSNGSSLYGHNYTYVNSTWGSLVQILMDSKIMNPIIFIDEVDKISKTENGKEIINTLIHLLDSTQNSYFQDKFFSGIPIDFSKVLFILSYNDPSQMDKIFLDRIHRIPFSPLKLNEKIEISKKFLLPSIFESMGLMNCIFLSDYTIEYIIENYTNEPGVRKLKEIFFELIGYINLQYLKTNLFEEFQLPICIYPKDIEENYFKDKQKMFHTKISLDENIGKVNGLWVNQDGQSGILPIEICHFYSKNMNELKLTGMQGDVMKESMNVSLSVVLNLLKEKRIDCCETNGIHIHCPEGSIPKNGPSAGLAISCALYSLFTKNPIPSHIAMTGEIDLVGNILPIGGLVNKINGGIKAGVNCFLFPKENEQEIKDKKEKITYLSFSHIKEVLEYLFIE